MASVTYPLPQSNFSLISAESEPPNYLWRPTASYLFLSLYSHVIAGHDHSSNKSSASLYFAPRRYSDVESFDSGTVEPQQG